MSKDYEIFTKNFYEALSNSNSLVVSKFRHNHKFNGATRAWKVDISYSLTVSRMKIKVFIECKHWNKKVDINVITHLHNCLRDCGANKGIVVTTIGYSPEAIKTAKKHGIALTILTDKKDFQMVSEAEGRNGKEFSKINTLHHHYSSDRQEKELTGIVYPQMNLAGFMESQLGKKIATAFKNCDMSPFYGHSASKLNQLERRILLCIKKFNLIQNAGLPIEVLHSGYGYFHPFLNELKLYITSQLYNG